MTTNIKAMLADEMNQIAGGVIEGPDGKSCTEHDTETLNPGGSDEWGGAFGPLTLDQGTGI